METKNTNRIQTDRAIFRRTVPEILSLIPKETKIAIFDRMYSEIGEVMTDLGHMRTENMAEDYVAVISDGEVVQVTGYDVITAMKEKTQVKTTGTRQNLKSKQAIWKKSTAQVKLGNFDAEYLHAIVSLNHLDKTSTAIDYLIPRIALLTESGTIRTQIDFDYGFNSSLDNRCKWHPYILRSKEDLATRYEAMPVLEKLEVLFENL